MAESWRKIGSRVLSGRGRFKFPIEDPAKIRSLVVSTTLIRPPLTEYINKKYEPNASFYGYICWQQGQYVIRNDDIKFRKQKFYWEASPNGILQRQLACVNQELLQSIANLGASLGFTPLSIQNETKDWLIPQYAPDELTFVCYADSGIYVEIQGLDYDKCQELEGDDPPVEPPPPPDPPPSVNPGTPIVVSPPNLDDTGDEFDPTPIDEPLLPDIEYELVFVYDLFGVAGTPSAGNDLFNQEATFPVPSSNFTGEFRSSSFVFGTCPQVPQVDIYSINLDNNETAFLGNSTTCHTIVLKSVFTRIKS